MLFKKLQFAAIFSLIATCGYAGTPSFDAVIRLIEFEVRQKASISLALNPDNSHGTPSKPLDPNTKIDQALLKKVWPYSLPGPSDIDLEEMKDNEPQGGATMFTEHFLDIQLESGNEKKVLRQLNRYIGSFLGNNKPPAYLLASTFVEAKNETVEAVAVELEKVLGGTTEQWKIGVTHGLKGIKTLAQRTTLNIETIFEASLKSLEERSPEDPKASTFLAALTALRERLAREENGLERMNLIHGTLTALLLPVDPDDQAFKSPVKRHGGIDDKKSL